MSWTLVLAPQRRYLEHHPKRRLFPLHSPQCSKATRAIAFTTSQFELEAMVIFIVPALQREVHM